MPEHTNEVAEFLKRIREEKPNNGLPAYAWPGGYTILYYCASGDILCADCATKALDEGDDDPPVAYSTYDEGEDEVCADCNKVLESSYGVSDNGAY